jgi:hypothetical protein
MFAVRTGRTGPTGLRPARVAMVKPAGLRDADHAPAFWRLDGARHRGIAVER